MLHCSAFSQSPAVIHILVALNGTPNAPLIFTAKSHIQCPSMYFECPEISEGMHQCQTEAP